MLGISGLVRAVVSLAYEQGGEGYLGSGYHVSHDARSMQLVWSVMVCVCVSGV